MAPPIPSASFDILLIGQCNWGSYWLAVGCRLRANLNDGMAANELAANWLNICFG